MNLSAFHRRRVIRPATATTSAQAVKSNEIRRPMMSRAAMIRNYDCAEKRKSPNALIRQGFNHHAIKSRHVKRPFDRAEQFHRGTL